MQRLVQIAKAMGDESRLRILRVLMSGAYNVAELTSILVMGQSRVSRHLKLLLDAGLTRVRREGTWAWYDSSAISTNGRDGLPAKALALLCDHDGDAPWLAGDESRRQACLEQRRQKNREFHDRGAPGWARLREEPFGDSDLSARVLAALGDNRQVADLGCGPGVLLPAPVSHAQRVIGVDTSQAMLDQAVQTLADLEAGLRGRIELRLGALEHLPLADGEVDAALMNMVLHHLAEPATVLREVKRILSAGGRLVICDLLRHDDEAMREDYGDLWLGFEEEGLRRSLSDAGFVVEAVEHHQESDRVGIMLFQARARD